MKTKFRVIAFLICIITALSLLPCVSAAEEPVVLTGIETSGFTVEGFDKDTSYYTVFPSSFENLSFKSFTSNIPANFTITVERYCDYSYLKTYSAGQTMNLGYGRARVTVTATSKTDAGNKKSYLFAFTDKNQQNYRYCSFKSATTVYQKASVASKTIATLSKTSTNSTMPLAVEQSGAWTKIVIPSGYKNYHGQIGWVKTEQLVVPYQQGDIAPFYQTAISKLSELHPSWTFEYRYMDVKMDDYANTIARLYYNNSGRTVDKATVLKAMNPQNYLDEKNIFMFLDISRYNESDFTSAGVGELWVEKANAVCTEKEAIDYFLLAGKSLRLNTYFLTARAVLESGHGTSALSKGIAGTDGRLYYNFYGIQAYDKDPSSGAYYAERRGWDTPLRSIIEGGNWINDQYLQRGQNTPYFLRYFPYKDHLYMTDLEAPQKDAANIYKCYKGASKLDSALHFIIPVFDPQYSDVPFGSWFYEDVSRATDYGLFEGGSNGNFLPNDTLTRAQFVTVLSRMVGADVSKYSNTKFVDVPESAWYAKYVAWSYETGITTGVSETEFDPERPISRQELCTMLARFATKQNIQMKKGTLSFTDTDTIDDWAKDGVEKCVGEGLVNGKPDGSFAPIENASRAQGAKILSLFYEKHYK